MTSGAFSWKVTVCPTGRCSSLAVVIFCCGYRNSHHHCLPWTSTRSAVAAGASWVLKITRMVGIAKISRITANAMVQEISSTVWPCTCLGMGAPGRSRKRQHA